MKGEYQYEGRSIYLDSSLGDGTAYFLDTDKIEIKPPPPTLWERIRTWFGFPIIHWYDGL